MTQRVLLQFVIKVRHCLESLIEGTTKRARTGEVALHQVGLECFLETSVLVHHQIELASTRIDRPIQDDAPHILGKGVDIDRANQCPV